ncbi:hypothetical protein [Methylorubrum extorquens]
MKVFSYIEGFYNRLRDSALGYRSPVIYEQEIAPEASTMNLISQAPF